ncbi:MAG: fibronectin type III domain-containing protein, partial [Methylosarcina sp.]
MKYSTFHSHGKPRITSLILKTSISLCLVGAVGLAQVNSAEAARWGGGWGGGGGGNWGGSRDTTAPTVPSSLTAAAASSSQIDLSWGASSDSVGVKGYKVYRGSTQIATVTTTSFSNTGLSADTTYQYSVAAYDAAGNTSSKSSSASATTSSSGGDNGGDGGGDGGTVSGAPAGIYSIDTVVDKPFVDGVLVRIYWSEIEKTEGKYDFSKLDSTIQKAEAAGQSVSIATMVMAAPTWLESKCTTYNDPQFGKTIVPWDTTMLSALEKLITALSTHQINGTATKDYPTVKQVDAAIGGIQSVRLTQLPSGYSASTFKDSVNRSVSAWAKAFPNKNIYVGLFGVSDNEPSTTEDIRDDLMAQYNNVNFFQEVLSGSA